MACRLEKIYNYLEQMFEEAKKSRMCVSTMYGGGISDRYSTKDARVILSKLAYC